MLQYIVHLPLQLIFEVMQLPSLLLYPFDLPAPLQLVGSQLLLHDSALSLQDEDSTVVLDL